MFKILCRDMLPDFFSRVLDHILSTENFTKSVLTKLQEKPEMDVQLVDVFITNYIYVDPEIFSCWLEGLTR